MAVHQMEHELSGMDEKIAHGAGLSALWASWARYVYENNVSRFAQYAVNVWNIEMDFEHPEKTALAGIKATEDYFKSLNMPTSLRELNVDPASFEELAEKCTNTAQEHWQVLRYWTSRILLKFIRWHIKKQQ